MISAILTGLFSCLACGIAKCEFSSGTWLEATSPKNLSSCLVGKIDSDANNASGSVSDACAGPNAMGSRNDGPASGPVDDIKPSMLVLLPAMDSSDTSLFNMPDSGSCVLRGAAEGIAKGSKSSGMIAAFRSGDNGGWLGLLNKSSNPNGLSWTLGLLPFDADGCIADDALGEPSKSSKPNGSIVPFGLEVAGASALSGLIGLDGLADAFEIPSNSSRPRGSLAVAALIAGVTDIELCVVAGTFGEPSRSSKPSGSMPFRVALGAGAEGALTIGAS